MRLTRSYIALNALIAWPTSRPSDQSRARAYAAAIGFQFDTRRLPSEVRPE